MKKWIFLMAMVFVVYFINAAHAALIDRGGGLIYDDVLNVTWLQDANYVNTTGYDDELRGYNTDGRLYWHEAVAWAENLVFYDSVRDVNWDDWRLPRTLPVNGNYYTYDRSYDGSTDNGYNISATGSAYPGSTASEMAYMFYNNLGNVGYFGVNGYNPMPNYGLSNTGPFIYIEDTYPYWSGTEYIPDSAEAWQFHFGYGFQWERNKGGGLMVGAVRAGDVPIPGAVWLLGSGLIALVGLRRRLKR